MNIKDNLISIYISENSLLKNITDKLLNCTSDEVHDHILNIFHIYDIIHFLKYIVNTNMKSFSYLLTIFYLLYIIYIIFILIGGYK